MNRRRKSARASATYTYSDTYGRLSEFAVRDTDGAVFRRDYGFNGFGRGFNSWAPAELDLTARFVGCPASVEIGFGRARRDAEAARVRLPLPLQLPLDDNDRR